MQVLNGHKASVNVLDSVYLEDNLTYIASSSVDSTVRIWKRRYSDISKLESENFSHDQVLISKSNGFALALKFYELPMSKSKDTLIKIMRMITFMSSFFTSWHASDRL